MKKKGFIWWGLFIIFLTVFACASSSGAGRQFDLVLMHTNDSVYDTFDLKGEEDYSSKSIGFPRLKTLLNYHKARSDNFLLLDGGDVFGGGPFPILTKGEALVELFNYLDYDAVAVGNHEFDHGQEQLTKLKNEANFSLLSANVVYKDTQELLFTPYIIKEYGDIKIGILGLTTPETKYTTFPVHVKNLDFLDVIETAQKYTKILLEEEKVQFIIVVGHLGTDASTAKNEQSLAVMQEVPEVDLFIDGHSERVLPRGIEVSRGRYIVEAGKNLSHVGLIRIGLNYEKDEVTQAITVVPNSKMVRVQLLSVADISAQKIQPDIGAQDIIQRYMAQINENFKEVIAYTNYFLQGERESVRRKETNLGNLIADAFKDHFDADISFINGGGIRASIDKGNISLFDVYTAVPFYNRAVLLEVSGSQILKALEHGLAYAPTASNGAFPQISGMKVTYNSSYMVGKRVVSVEIGGKRLDPYQTYRLATLDFLLEGGDGYQAFLNLKGIYGPSTFEVVSTYIRSKGVDSRYPGPQGRIVETETQRSRNTSARFK